MRRSGRLSAPQQVHESPFGDPEETATSSFHSEAPSIGCAGSDTDAAVTFVVSRAEPELPTTSGTPRSGDSDSFAILEVSADAANAVVSAQRREMVTTGGSKGRLRDPFAVLLTPRLGPRFVSKYYFRQLALTL